MVGSDSLTEYYEAPPPYPKYDGEQVKRLWLDPNWSLSQRLKERVRILKAIFLSQGWPPSTEALRARQELTKAHFRILCLRRKLRKETLVPEDIERLEEMSYGRYAMALNKLEHCTGYRFQHSTLLTDSSGGYNLKKKE